MQLELTIMRVVVQFTSIKKVLVVCQIVILLTTLLIVGVQFTSIVLVM